jgi:hypothetical protein
MTDKFLAILRRHVEARTTYCHGGNLRINDSDELRVLPDIQVIGNVELENLPRLEYLPLSISKCNSLIIKRCGKLERIPCGLGYDDVYIADCRQLKTLPHGFSVRHNLSLVDCPKIERFPDYAFVGGTLTLAGCGSLRTIGCNLWVGTSLLVQGCSNVVLPDDLYVDTGIVKISDKRPGLFREVRVKFDGREIPPVYPPEGE